MSPYRSVLPGYLVSRGIHAMARGFAKACHRPAPTPAPRPSPWPEYLRATTGLLRSLIVIKRDITLRFARAPASCGALLIAEFDGARYVETITDIEMAIEHRPIIPLLRAVERLAERINREFR